jgi:hypothetical protein
MPGIKEDERWKQILTSAKHVPLCDSSCKRREVVNQCAGGADERGSRWWQIPTRKLSQIQHCSPAHCRGSVTVAHFRAELGFGLAAKYSHAGLALAPIDNWQQPLRNR